MSDGLGHIQWEFAPFYRNWRGWRRVLWWAWPVRWWVVIEIPGMRSMDAYCTANDAAVALARMAAEHAAKGKVKR